MQVNVSQIGTQFKLIYVHSRKGLFTNICVTEQDKQFHCHVSQANLVSFSEAYELTYPLWLLEFIFELRVTLQVDKLQLKCIWCLFAVCVERRRQYVKLRREFFEVYETACKFTVECLMPWTDRRAGLQDLYANTWRAGRSPFADWIWPSMLPAPEIACGGMSMAVFLGRLRRVDLIISICSVVK